MTSVTGRGTVPCLFVDGAPMFESAEIVAWLEQTFAVPGRDP
jgi:glutathione S-transferase